jgi:hypothetical protein
VVSGWPQREAEIACRISACPEIDGADWGLWRVAVLEMSHSLFQRLRTFGGNLVTVEGNLGCPEYALRRVDDDPIPLNVVHDELKGLGSIAQAVRHEGELE